MELEELIKVAQDEEGRKALIATITELKAELTPALLMLVELVGPDLDNIFNKLQDFVANKTYRAYLAYQEVGFTEEQSFILAANTKVEIGERLNNIKR